MAEPIVVIVVLIFLFWLLRGLYPPRKRRK